MKEFEGTCLLRDEIKNKIADIKRRITEQNDLLQQAKENLEAAERRIKDNLKNILQP